MKTCPSCKGEMKPVEDILSEIEGYVFIVKGERCAACKEEIIDEDETERMISAARKLGVWPEPLKLHRHLTKSGGGLLFRIPSDIERQLQLSEGGEIAISKVGNKMVIEMVGSE